MWIDKNRRVYIIFTLKEVMETLNCGDKKATRLMGELEKCGLIERDRRGLGKPNLIYVKNFNSKVPLNERFQTRQNDDSGVGNMEIQDSSEQRGTNTNKNYIDESNTYPILSSEEMGTEVNEVNEWAMMYQYFWNQLYFEYLLMDYPLERESLEEMPHAEIPMVVVTNEDRVNGVATMFYPGVMDEIGEKLGSNFFVLPSSLHETIVVPNDGNMEYKALLAMVTEINATQVDTQDKLTDQVYHYDVTDKVFEKASRYEDRKQEKDKSHEKKSVLKKLEEKKDEAKATIGAKKTSYREVVSL